MLMTINDLTKRLKRRGIEGSVTIPLKSSNQRLEAIILRLSKLKCIIPQYVKPENGIEYDDIKLIKNELNLYECDNLIDLDIELNTFKYI
jgi:hypothetical protein